MSEQLLELTQPESVRGRAALKAQVDNIVLSPSRVTQAPLQLGNTHRLTPQQQAAAPSRNSYVSIQPKEKVIPCVQGYIDPAPIETTLISHAQGYIENAPIDTTPMSHVRGYVDTTPGPSDVTQVLLESGQAGPIEGNMHAQTHSVRMGQCAQVCITL